MDNVSVLECAWLRFIAVTDEIYWLCVFRWNESPFYTSWETSTTHTRNTSISNYDAGVGRQDVLRLEAGIIPSDVQVTRSSYSLKLTLQSTNEVITVQNHFINNSYMLNAVEFADGTSWDGATLALMVLNGTEGADNITGFTTDDTINGLGGNDILNGGGGNDTLNGGDGQDAVNGGAGDDTLSGGIGSNDTLRGDAGNDTYLQKPGSADVLNDSQGIDSIDLGNADQAVQVDLSLTPVLGERRCGADDAAILADHNGIDRG